MNTVTNFDTPQLLAAAAEQFALTLQLYAVPSTRFDNETEPVVMPLAAFIQLEELAAL